VHHIKILGTGCPKCRSLEANARAAAEQAGVEFTLEKVTDLNRIMEHGVMMTPGLVIDDEVKSTGRLVDVASIRAMLVA
jgi:small redox-active disulfide protein 2